ncbi:MAG: FIST signal transduction protein [Solirubrobacteraceae bacterium]
MSSGIEERALDIDVEVQERVPGVGYSQSSDPAVAASEAIASATAQQPVRAGDLVIVLVTADLDPDEFHAAAVQAAAPAAVVGCTSHGSFCDVSQVPAGAVAAFLPADNASFGICHVDVDSDIAGAARRAAELARERAGEELEHSVLLMLADGKISDQRETARGAYEVTSALIPFVGGVAGDDMSRNGVRTFGEGRVLRDGIVSVWITSERQMAFSVDHGWRPVGKPMLVTRADRCVVHELDGRPAYETFVAGPGAPLNESAATFNERALARPVGLPNAQGRYEARQVLDVHEDGSLEFTTAIPEQTVMQVMTGDSDSLLRGAGAAAATVARDLDAPIRLALVFSCAARVALLGHRVAEEAELISKELGGAPIAGFFTFGEFARLKGSSGVHNSSVAILAL